MAKTKTTKEARAKNAARVRRWRSRATTSGNPASRPAGLEAGDPVVADEPQDQDALQRRLAALRARATAPEVAPVPVQAQAQGSQKREAWLEESGRKRSTPRPRVPLRPHDTPKLEVERYASRRAAWEARPTMEGYRERQAEYVEHLRACVVPTWVGPVSEGSPVHTCPDDAHILPRRTWHGHVQLDKLDLRHLRGCEAESQESCRDYHPAHLLPPEPLALEETYCCVHKCFLKEDGRVATQCVMVSTQVTHRRKVEEAILGPIFGKSLEEASGSVLVTNRLNPELAWGFRAAQSIYDPAMTPLREDGWGA